MSDTTIQKYYNGHNLTLPEISNIGKVMASSGFFSDAKQAGQAVVKILAGQEMGFNPIVSMTKIHVIKGKITLSAELMASMIKRHPDYDYKITEHNLEKCVIDFFENKEKVYTSEFTLTDAKKAGVYKTDSGWTKFPRAMLFSRALSQGARIACPHLLNGAYTSEEMGAAIDETGEIVSVETVQPESDNGNGKKESESKTAPKNDNLDKKVPELIDLTKKLFADKYITEKEKEKFLTRISDLGNSKQADELQKELINYQKCRQSGFIDFGIPGNGHKRFDMIKTAIGELTKESPHNVKDYITDFSSDRFKTFDEIEKSPFGQDYMICKLYNFCKDKYEWNDLKDNLTITPKP